MRCPKCQTPMQELLQRGVLVDLCRGCGATWFDGGELRRAIGHEVRWGQVAAISLEDSGLPCPRCANLRLEERRAGKGPTVTLDVCARCGGVLLDRGELPQLEALAQAQRGTQARLLAELKEPGVQTQAGVAAAAMAQRQGERATEALPPSVPDGLLGVLLAALRLPYFAEGATGRTPAVWALLASLVVVYLLEAGLDASALVVRWTMVPANVLAGQGLWTVVTSMFAHASLPHLLGNGYFLWLFGSQLESRFGAGRFLTGYFAAGLVGQVAVLAADPHGTVSYLGASGAIAGVMAYSLVAFPRARIVQYVGRYVVAPLTMPQAVYVAFWFALQVAGVLFKAPGVAWWAHLGGFAGGLAFAFATRRRSTVD